MSSPAPGPRKEGDGDKAALAWGAPTPPSLKPQRLPPSRYRS